MLKLKNQKIGFSLAEVLITLGIIGIIAAITIPSLITKYQKQRTVTQLKKTYSVLQQAIKMASEEYGDCEGWEYNLTGEEFIKRYFLPYLKATEVNMPLTYIDLKGVVQKDTSHPKFMLNDGSIIMYIYTEGMFECRNHLVVDLNGSAGPNRLGRDVFILSFFENILTTYTQYKRPSLSTHENLIKPGTSGQCSRQANGGVLGPGSYCSRLIEVDSWSISKDYPW